MIVRCAICRPIRAEVKGEACPMATLGRADVIAGVLSLFARNDLPMRDSVEGCGLSDKVTSMPELLPPGHTCRGSRLDSAIQQAGLTSVQQA